MSRGIKPYAFGPREDLRLDAGEWSCPFVISLTTEAATDSYDIWTSAPRDLRVLDAWVVSQLTGINDDITVQNAGNPITNDISCATEDALTRATSIDTTYWEIDKGGVLRVTTDDGAVGVVFIVCEWRE